MDNLSNQKHFSNKIRIIIGGLTLILILLLAIPRLFVQYPPQLLADIHWKKPPGLLAVQEVTREDKTGLITLRLEDGKEQFFAGNWQIDFADSGNAFIFSPSAPQIYVIEGQQIITPVQVKNLPGTITTIQENPRQTYMAIAGQGDSRDAFCIAEKISDTGDQTPSCQTVRIQGTAAQGRWNPQEGQQFVLRTAQGEIYTQDAWETKSDHVSRESDPARHQILSALFENPVNPRRVEGLNGPREFFRVANLVFIRNLKQGWQNRWSIARVPLTAKVGWIVDDNHLLIKTKNRLDILELETKKITSLLEESDIGRKVIEYRVAGFDQTL